MSALIQLTKDGAVSDEVIISRIREMKIDPQILVQASKVLVRTGNLADKAYASTVPSPVSVAQKPVSKIMHDEIKPVKISAMTILKEEQPGECDFPNFETKLSFDSVNSFMLPSIDPTFESAMKDAHFGSGSNPTFDQALKEIKQGRKTSCWAWYICPALKEIRGRPPGSMYPQFLIPDFGNACMLFMTPWFFHNFITFAEAVNEKLAKGVSLDVLFGKPHDAERYRQSVYLFVLAAQCIGKTTYFRSQEIKDIASRVLVRTLSLMKYNFHDLTFDIAQRWISSHVPAGTAAKARSLPKEWNCRACTFSNGHTLTKCAMCATKRSSN